MKEPPRPELKPALTITQRRVGDIVILDFDGRISLGVGSSSLRDTIRGLVALGTRHFVLNFENVRYIDSSGIGEMVTASTTVSRMGGSLKLYKPAKRVRDLLQITKLYTALDVLTDDDIAVKSFAVPPSRFLCPVCGSLVTLPPRGSDDWDLGEQCKECEVIIKLADNGAGADEVPVERIVIRMYPGEQIVVAGVDPIRLDIDGRLNLFTSSFLKKAWRAVPKPHKVLISLRKVTEVDSAGAEALTALVSGEDGGPRIAVSLDGLKRADQTLFPYGPQFFEDERMAVQSFADAAPGPGIVVIIKVG